MKKDLLLQFGIGAVTAVGIVGLITERERTQRKEKEKPLEPLTGICRTCNMSESNPSKMEITMLPVYGDRNIRSEGSLTGLFTKEEALDFAEEIVSFALQLPDSRKNSSV